MPHPLPCQAKFCTSPHFFPTTSPRFAVCICNAVVKSKRYFLLDFQGDLLLPAGIEILLNYVRRIT